MTDNMFSDLIPDQSANYANMFADLIPPQQTSYGQNVMNDFSNSMNQIGHVWANQNLNPSSQAVQMLSSGMTGALSPFTEAAKSGYSVLPDAITTPINNAASAVRQGVKTVYQKDVDALANTSGGKAVGDYLMNSPHIQSGMQEVSDDAKSLANILSFSKVAEVGAPIANDVIGGGGAGIKAAKEAAIDPLIEKVSPTLSSASDISTTNDALKSNKTIAYNNAKTQGAVLTPAASDHVGITVPAQVESQLGIRLDPNDPTYSQTRSALANLQNKSAIGLTTNDLEQTRQRLNDILNGSSSGGDRVAAIVAKKSLDGISAQIEQNPRMLVGGNTAAIQAFRDAREANGIYQRHTDVSNIISDAKSNPSKIQSAFQKLVSSKNENDFNLYPDDEKKIITDIAYPNGIDTKLEGGGLGSKVLHAGGIIGKGVAGSLAGGEVGHPLIGAAVGAGQGIYTAINDAVKSSKILKGADDLQKLIASKSKPITPVVPSNPQKAFLRQISPVAPSVPSPVVPVGGGVP